MLEKPNKKDTGIAKLKVEKKYILGKSQIAVRVMLFRARETLAEHAIDRGPARPAADAPRAAEPTPVLSKTVPGGVS